MPAGRPLKLTVDATLAAIPGSYGVCAVVCKRLGCTYPTFLRFRERHPSVQAALDAEKELLFDLVESQLIKKILAGNITCLIYFSKCQMKARGYVERVEHTGADGEPLQMSLSERLEQVHQAEKRQKARLYRVMRQQSKEPSDGAAPVDK